MKPTSVNGASSPSKMQASPRVWFVTQATSGMLDDEPAVGHGHLAHVLLSRRASSTMFFPLSLELADGRALPVPEPAGRMARSSILSGNLQKGAV